MANLLPLSLTTPRTVATLSLVGSLLVCLTSGHAQPITLKWLPIDCSSSDILLAGTTKCEESAPWSGTDGQAQYFAQRAQVLNTSEHTYVYVYKPRIALMTGGVAGLSPEEREKWLSGPSPDAVNFSSTLRVAGGYAKTFSVPSGWYCFSFVKDGPPLGSSYGVAFSMWGYHCKKSPQAPSEAAIGAFMESLSVKR